MGLWRTTFNLFLVVASAPVYAEGTRSEGWTTTFNGSFKSIAGIQQLRQTGIFPRDTQWVSEQRLRINATASKDWFRFELADEASFFLQQANDPLLFIGSNRAAPAWSGTTTIADTEMLDILNRIDRLNVQARMGDTEVIVGKQVIPLGVGKIFSAISQVPPQPFIRVDPEYANTEDAVTWKWEGPLSLEARFLPRTPLQSKSGFHFRAKGSKAGYDVALTGGRSDDKFFIGLETAGNLGESLFRAEVAFYNENQRDWAQALMGMDHTLSAKWSGKLELFYNGFGETQDNYAAATAHRNTNLRGKYYAGMGLTYEASERLKANLLAMINVLDPSSLLHWTLGYSLNQNTELLLGQFLNVAGTATGEFGGKQRLIPSLPASPELGYSDFTFLLVKYYF